MNMDHDLITAYCGQMSDDVPAYLTALDQYTHEHHSGAEMLSGAFQGRLLSLISKMIRPKVVLEIGTYTGYSALCFAEGLAPEGRVHSIDVDERLKPTHDLFIGNSPYADRITIYFEDAKQLIPRLDLTLDLVFIDGAKKDYATIFDLCLPKLRKGGVILADNVLWKGKVLIEGPVDANTAAIKSFNEKVYNNDEVDKFMLPIRDGLFWITKK